MRVSIYKQEDGSMSAMVEASPGKGRPPVLIQDITGENVTARVAPVIDAMRRPKGAESL